MYQLLNHPLYVVKYGEDDRSPIVMSKPELQRKLQRSKTEAKEIIVYKLITTVGSRLDNKSLCNRKFLKENKGWFE